MVDQGHLGNKMEMNRENKEMNWDIWESFSLPYLILWIENVVPFVLTSWIDEVI